MTVPLHENRLIDSLCSIKNTDNRGRGVYASQPVPEGCTIHFASEPFVSVIKEIFKKEVCAWCFKYEHGKTCPVKHPEPQAVVYFCSTECYHQWTTEDFDGKLTEALSSLRTSKARKQISSIEDFPLDQAKLVVSAIVQRTRESSRGPTWSQVLDLQSGIIHNEIDLESEIKQIIPFLKEVLPFELHSLIEPTAYPFLSRHLSNSFGIWELPISPDSEHLGSAMYPSASYFNHSCDPNVIKVREGRKILFVTARQVGKDEELCISYGHTERPAEERRQVLRVWWGFNCDCDRCRRELEELNK